MNTQRFMTLVAEGYTLEVADEPKVITEGTRENPVTQEHVDAVLVSPFQIDEMAQSEEKNRPVKTGKKVNIRVPVPHVTFVTLDPDLISSLVAKGKKRAGRAEQEAAAAPKAE